MSVLAQKVTLSLCRSFLIISLLGLAFNPLPAFQQSAVKKTKYEFTDTRVSEADTLLKKKKYQEALDAYQKAYDTYEQEGFYEGMVYAKERMGRTYRALGKDSLSRVTYSAAAALSRDGLGPNHLLESKAILNNGIRAHYKRKFELGAAYLDTAAWLYYQSSFVDSTILRSIIDFKFYTYYSANLNSDTLVKYLDEKAKFLEATSSNLNEKVFLLSDYNRVHFRKGDFQKASAYGLEAVRKSEEQIELITAFYYSDALFNLGRSLHRQGDLDQALSISDKLIDFTLSNNPKDRGLPGYRNLKAVILNGLERFEEAAQEFKSIVEFFEVKGIQDASYRSALGNLGVCYQKMKLYKLSEAQLTKALDLEKDSQTFSNAAFVERYKYLGQLYQAIGENKKSIYYYDSALRHAIPDNNAALLEYPFETRMDATYETLSIIRSKQISIEKQYKEERGEESEKLLRATIDYAINTHKHLMDNRKVLQASAGKLYLSRDFKDMYESALNAVYELSEVEGNSNELLKTAFGFFAKSKSNLFLEQSGEMGKIQTGLVPKSIAERYYELKTEISFLEKKFYQLFDEITTSDSLRFINSSLMSLNAELETVLEQIDERTQVQDSQDEVSYERIIKKVASDVKKGYLEYFVGEEYLFSLFLSKGASHFKRIRLDDSFYNNFEGLIGKLASKPIPKNYNSDLQEFQNEAFSLYKLLIGDLLSVSEGANQLMIVPDEQLSRLPFEVLVESQSDNVKYFYDLNYLIKKCTISYALSSSEVFLKPRPKTAQKGILGIGYSGDSQVETRSEELGALPGTEEEIKFLSSELEGDFLLGVEGSKSAFLNKASNYDILHLAVHGEANDFNRFESSLIFNGSEDNILETSDLFVANLEARLAVLSACESGVGQINRGEGTFSIARGFALVGVPSIIMSLWRVNDKIASDLMVDFHVNMIEGAMVSDALTQSKLNFLLNESGQYTSHPYYWSAFVALGDDVTLESDDVINNVEAIIVMLVILLLTTVFVVIIRKKRRRAQ